MTGARLLLAVPLLAALLVGTGCAGTGPQAGSGAQAGRFSTTEAVLALLADPPGTETERATDDTPRPSLQEADRRVYLSLFEGVVRAVPSRQPDTFAASLVLVGLADELRRDVAAGRLVAAQRLGSRLVAEPGRRMICDLWRIQTQGGGSEAALCGEVVGLDVLVVRHVAREGTDPRFQRAIDYVSGMSLRRRTSL